MEAPQTKTTHQTVYIESIEILKGAPGAFIYGSRASSGVIVITTKKGQAGKTRVSFDQSVGMATILNRLGNRQFTAETAEASFGASGLAAFQAANASGNIFDLEDQLYGNRGMLYNTHLGISGGDERTKFYGAVLRKNESGIVENTGYDKTSLRFNFSHKISRNLDLGVNTNFVTSSADRGYFNNDNTGTTMGISFVSTPTWVDLRPDDNGNYPNNPNAPSNFLQTRDLVTNNESVNRFIAGANLTWKIRETERSSLRLIGNAGIDKYTLVTNVIFPRELQFQKNGNGTNGASIQGNTTVNNTNTQAFLVHNFYPSQRIGFTTQAGVLALNFDRNTILATATQLVGSQTNIDQAGSVAIEHTKVPQTDYGFYLQEEVNFSDIVIATVGLRADKSSNNGDSIKMYYYLKANVALNIHEMGFWGVDGVNQLKLTKESINYDHSNR